MPQRKEFEGEASDIVRQLRDRKEAKRLLTTEGDLSPKLCEVEQKKQGFVLGKGKHAVSVATESDLGKLLKAEFSKAKNKGKTVIKIPSNTALGQLILAEMKRQKKFNKKAKKAVKKSKLIQKPSQKKRSWLQKILGLNAPKKGSGRQQIFEAPGFKKTLGKSGDKGAKTEHSNQSPITKVDLKKFTVLSRLMEERKAFVRQHGDLIKTTTAQQVQQTRPSISR